MNNINKYIDHTILKAETTQKHIDQIVNEAIEYDFASVCVNPTWVKYVSSKLIESNVKTCTVIGFPLGANTLETKVFEAKNAIENGASEIDMVINIANLKNQDQVKLLDEINQVKDNIGNHILKVIVETALLTTGEKEFICKVVKQSNADFIKTSTGFSSSGATVEDIVLFKKIAQDQLQIKASGGVRSLEDLEVMVNAGASRVGTSGGVNIMKNKKNESDY